MKADRLENRAADHKGTRKAEGSHCGRDKERDGRSHRVWGSSLRAPQEVGTLILHKIVGAIVR